jgi:lysophospholipase L1-like esterase
VERTKLAIENVTECRELQFGEKRALNLVGSSAENELNWRIIMRLTKPLLFGLIGISLTGDAVVMKGDSDSHNNWVETWAAAPMAHANKSGMFATDTTLRQIVHVSVGGSAMRVVLTNEFGTADLKIGAASVAVPVAIPSANASNAEPGKPVDPLKGNSAVTPGSIVPVRFGGQNGTTVFPGAIAISDPVPFSVAPQSDLAISIFIPGQTVDVVSLHQFSDQANFVADGNQVTASVLNGDETTWSWRLLKGVLVSGNARGAIVCLGDSITDGALSKPNLNHRYPDVLAARLQANPSTAGWAVLNAGIGGNSVLHDAPFTGPSALERFDRDVIAHAGVRYVILLEGINDIDRVSIAKQPSDVISADDLISAYRQLIVRAHLHSIKVIGATLTPFGGSHGESEASRVIYEKVNAFIRSSGEFDGVVDFNKATADPDDPRRLAKAYDGGDHLHPSDAGYKAMGESIDLTLFIPVPIQ